MNVVDWSNQNGGFIELLALILGIISLFGAVLYRRLKHSSKGGKGGKAEVLKGQGSAIGGKGGDVEGSGIGGDGGDAKVASGSGKAIGGRGGKVVSPKSNQKGLITVASKQLPEGGRGGNATSANGGQALGGNGGRSGMTSGGPGGDASCLGPNSFCRGGDGGDGPQNSRPALGARSPLEYESMGWDDIPQVKDKYGLFLPGRGGDGDVAEVEYRNALISFNAVLHLLRRDYEYVLDTIDNIDIASYQEWFDTAHKHFPDELRHTSDHVWRIDSKVQL